MQPEIHMLWYCTFKLSYSSITPYCKVNMSCLKYKIAILQTLWVVIYMGIISTHKHINCMAAFPGIECVIFPIWTLQLDVCAINGRNNTRETLFFIETQGDIGVLTFRGPGAEPREENKVSNSGQIRSKITVI